MLNRTIVIKQLMQSADKLCPSTHDVIAALAPLWNTLMHDAILAQQFQGGRSADSDLTSWNVQTPPVHMYEPLQQYTIVAVDGSQIYPDRHQLADCFLLNISRVVINYGLRDGSVVLTSEPSLHLQAGEGTMHMNTERVNALRSVHEFETLYQAAAVLQSDQPATVCLVALIDGPVGFWQLGTISDEQTTLLERYLSICTQFYERKLLHAGYTSLPRATDIVRCLRRFYATTEKETDPVQQRCVDADLLETILIPGQATRWFTSTVVNITDYPSHIRPHFCYLHVGPELARVEVPAWIAKDETYSAQILRAALSQAYKGRGYPIALAEAHEQAVVKGADRDFFYQTLYRITRGSGTRRSASQKLLRKRYL